MIQKGHFLLMNPDAAVTTKKLSSISNIKVYPSPAATNNKLEYEVKGSRSNQNRFY